MGFFSLITAVLGLLTTLCHYASHSKVMGAVNLVILIVSMVTGIMDIRKKNGSKISHVNHIILMEMDLL